jgi:xylulokinase
VTAAAVGIDVGTTGARGVGVDEAGRVIAASSPYPPLTPRLLRTGQDPAEWWRATQTVPAELTGQMHGSVFLDSPGKVIRRALLWNDQPTRRAGTWNLCSVYRNLYSQTARDMHPLSALAGR